MAEALLTQHIVRRVIGQSRLQRLIRAGWLKPIRRDDHSILYAPRDVHAALRRLERKFCPPDRIEVARVRLSEARNGHPGVRKEKPLKIKTLDFELDLSSIPEVYD
jgi:hypothetical protein